jgi:hypothetical protein
VTTRERRRRLRIRKGRPRKLNARRRATTLAGRRAPDDQGTPQLRAKKRAVTSRENLEINPAAALFGHGAIDALQYETLGLISLWLRTLARAWGGEASVTGLWAAILGGLISTDLATRNRDDMATGLAVGARRQLARAVQRLDGSRSLVTGIIIEGPIPPVVFRVIEDRLTRGDKIELEHLRQSLDELAGRRAQHARNST